MKRFRLTIINRTCVSTLIVMCILFECSLSVKGETTKHAIKQEGAVKRKHVLIRRHDELGLMSSDLIINNNGGKNSDVNMLTVRANTSQEHRRPTRSASRTFSSEGTARNRDTHSTLSRGAQHGNFSELQERSLFVRRSSELKTLFSLEGVPIKPSDKVKKMITAEQLPKDFCIMFDLTFPTDLSKNKAGYGGAILMVDGRFYITLARKNNIATGGACSNDDDECLGFLLIHQSEGDGPYYATPGVGKLGARHKAALCFVNPNVPRWDVDGKNVGKWIQEAKIIPNDGEARFLHTVSTPDEDMGSGAILHNFAITTATADEIKKDTLNYAAFEAEATPAASITIAKCLAFIAMVANLHMAFAR